MQEMHWGKFKTAGTETVHTGPRLWQVLHLEALKTLKDKIAYEKWINFIHKLQIYIAITFTEVFPPFYTEQFHVLWFQ